MVENCLLDTNVLVYYVNGLFDKDPKAADALFAKSFNISVITEMEFLG